MTMITAQRAICKTALFSADRLGEIISYNGEDIVAIVEIGADMSRTDWNDAATAVENANLGDLATFSVLDTDVSEPSEGDIIIYEDINYKVTQIINHDKAGGNFVLMAMKNGRAYGR